MTVWLVRAAALVFICCACGPAVAQITGSIDSIGFDNAIRPDCWTPMVVTLNPQTDKTDFYQLRVKVDDMDRDSAIYTRIISVTGVPGGQSLQQKFRMYFIPPPTDGGFLDRNEPGALKDLQDKVHASVCSAAGKWIADLPITTAVSDVDPSSGNFNNHRGRKLILTISDGRSSAVYADTANDLSGVMEDVKGFVQLHPADLPERALGYEAVDTIVWLDADPAALRAGGDEKFRALRNWVSSGGNLVISQPFDWQKILGFDDLLPVTNIRIEQKNTLSPLTELAKPTETQIAAGVHSNPFANTKGPYRFARAAIKPTAIVDRWIDWSEKDRTPYIARMPFGAGCVTWVAQDLGDPTLVTGRDGWANVWNHVFDWHDSPLVVTKNTQAAAADPWREGSIIDVGRSLLGGMDLTNKSVWLVSVAILFFTLYWFIAGPGSFLLLAARKSTQASWFVFGASALIATALTVLMVKLVLRGPPELKHFSVVRVPADGPADVRSHFGLYIPRDGNQLLALTDADPQHDSALSPLPIHPDLLKKSPEESGSEYQVPIVDQAAGQTVEMSVPYRSTLKKFQALWSGPLTGKIEGTAKLVEQNWIDGTLTNGTGHNLKNVYVAFKYDTGQPSQNNGNWMLYLPKWDDRISLNLNKIIRDDEPDAAGNPRRVLLVSDLNPPADHRVLGKIEQQWADYWMPDLERAAGPMNEGFDDTNAAVRESLPMLSFFECLPPSKNRLINQQERAITRVEVLRRGGRTLDVSAALSAGSLVILAQADTSLPVPFTVEGSPVTGSGTTLYQFILPLNHSELIAATP